MKQEGIWEQKPCCVCVTLARTIESLMLDVREVTFLNKGPGKLKYFSGLLNVS